MVVFLVLIFLYVRGNHYRERTYSRLPGLSDARWPGSDAAAPQLPAVGPRMSVISSRESAEAALSSASPADESVGLDYLVSLKGEQASQEALTREALVLHFDEFAASGDELEMYAFAILNTHGCRALNATPEQIAAFIHKIRAAYRDNPYHGWSHGFFVLRVTCLVLDVLPGLKSCLRPDEQCAYLIAALCHDVAHTGTNNAFEVKTKSPLALTYGDTSVLEKMHVAIMFQVMDDPALQLFSSMEQEVETKVRALMTSAVLMTDMMNHAGQVRTPSLAHKHV